MDEGNKESMQIQGYHNHPPEVLKRKSEQLERSLRTQPQSCWTATTNVVSMTSWRK